MTIKDIQMKPSAINIKNCPFCNSRAKWNSLSTRIGYSEYERTVASIIVECEKCHSKSAEVVIMPLCDFTKHTVSDFRNNPILRAKVEDEYEKYKDVRKEEVLRLWNNRANQSN